MNFSLISPVYTPLSPREVKRILGISNAGYQCALSSGILKKSLQYEARFSNETNMHSVVDLVFFDIFIYLGWPNFEIAQLVPDITHIVDNLCCFHEEISGVEAQNIDQYVCKISKCFHPELGDLRKTHVGPIDRSDFDDIARLAQFVWLKIIYRATSVIENAQLQFSSASKSSISQGFVGFFLEGSILENTAAANCNTPNIHHNIDKFRSCEVRLATW